MRHNITTRRRAHLCTCSALHTAGRPEHLILHGPIWPAQWPPTHDCMHHCDRPPDGAHQPRSAQHHTHTSARTEWRHTATHTHLSTVYTQQLASSQPATEQPPSTTSDVHRQESSISRAAGKQQRRCGVILPPGREAGYLSSRGSSYSPPDGEVCFFKMGAAAVDVGGARLLVR